MSHLFLIFKRKCVCWLICNKAFHPLQQSKPPATTREKQHHQAPKAAPGAGPKAKKYKQGFRKALPVCILHEIPSEPAAGQCSSPAQQQLRVLSALELGAQGHPQSHGESLSLQPPDTQQMPWAGSHILPHTPRISSTRTQRVGAQIPCVIGQGCWARVLTPLPPRITPGQSSPNTPEHPGQDWQPGRGPRPFSISDNATSLYLLT